MHPMLWSKHLLITGHFFGDELQKHIKVKQNIPSGNIYLKNYFWKTLPTSIQELFFVEHNESINNTNQTELVITFHKTTVGLSSLSYCVMPLNYVMTYCPLIKWIPWKSFIKTCKNICPSNWLNIQLQV